MRKLLTAALMECPENIIFDGISSSFGDPQLAAALTTGKYTTRLFRSSKIVDLDFRAITAAAGNNLKFKGNISQQVYWCRLATDQEKPWYRTSFKIPDIDNWVAENRKSLMNACMILIKAWIENRSKPSNIVWESFNEWSQTIGGVLANASINSFLGNQVDSK